jgi:hypothetical protein
MSEQRMLHPSNAVEQAEGTNAATATEPEHAVPTVIPEIALPPVSRAARGIAQALGDPLPDDVRDSQAMARRVQLLVEAAVAAGEAHVEFLARIHDERRLDIHLREGGCALVASDSLVDLHRALMRFCHDCVSNDGLHIARQAIEVEHGVGVADLVLYVLAQLRAELDATLREIAAGQSGSL